MLTKSTCLKQSLLPMAVISAGYLLLSYLLVGFKTDQLFLTVLVNGLYFASAVTRKLLLSFTAFIIFWVVFDYMKAFPNYAMKPVNIEALYNAEKHWFGIFYQGEVLTPNEFFAEHTHVAADVLSGIFYLSWVPVPIGLTMYFFFRNRPQAIHLSFTFLLVNLIGFVLYYLYPAAPPWYVKDYGFEFIKNTPGNAAGLSRFDEALGIHLFQSMYEKSSNVFAAMPSLHAAYPLVTLFYGLKNKLGKVNVLIGLSALGIWSSAVYSGHHYVLDILSGMLCAVIGIGLYQWLYRRKGLFHKMINGFIRLIMEEQ